MTPRVHIINGPQTGDWSGINSLLGGIELYNEPTIGGVYAQELWEWRQSLLDFGMFLSVVLIPVVGFRALPSQRAKREIFSHALTYQASLLLNEDTSEDIQLQSLSGYSYCKDINPDELLKRLRANYPTAKTWVQKNFSAIKAVKALAHSSRA